MFKKFSMSFKTRILYLVNNFLLKSANLSIFLLEYTAIISFIKKKIIN